MPFIQNEQRLAGGRANCHEQLTNRVRCHLCSSKLSFNVLIALNRREQRVGQANWTEENQTWANSLHNTSIPLDALVCWACVRLIRHQSTMGTKQHNIARECLDIAETAGSDCNPHYQHIYRALRFPLSHATCASQSWYGRRVHSMMSKPHWNHEVFGADGGLSMASCHLAARFANHVMNSIDECFNNTIPINQLQHWL